MDKNTREIKFRAVIKLNGSYKISDSFKLGENPNFGNMTLSVDSKDIIATLQYTGLKDKNGKDIYEGDMFYAKMMSSSPIGTYVKVIFDEGSFQVEDKKGDRCWNDYLVMTRGEVIGNIYENPEQVPR